MGRQELRSHLPDQEDAARTLGRPKDSAKRAAILRVARQMFFEQGLDAVTIEGVAAAAKVSRMTVYGHFCSKETLFKEVITQEGLQVGRALSRFSGCGMETGATDIASLRKDLVDFGIDLTNFLSSPEIRVWNRLMSAGAPSHPELAKAFLEAGPRAVMLMVAERLKRCAEARTLTKLDPLKAAGQFIGMLRSIESAAVSWGLAPQPSRDDVEQHVRDCVDTFLRAFTADTPR